MSIPYIEGKVEGDNFALQWISHMLNIDIQIWSTESQSFTQRFHSGYRPSKQLFLLQDTSQWLHVHYKPLIQEQISKPIVSQDIEQSNIGTYDKGYILDQLSTCSNKTGTMDSKNNSSIHRKRKRTSLLTLKKEIRKNK